jgi:hypothetical protein
VESVDRAHCGQCGRACTGTDECVLGQCVSRASTVIAAGLNVVNDAGGQSPYVHVVLDATNVYFVDGNGVHFVPKAGGAVKDLAPAAGKPARVAVDDTYAYWSVNLGAAIMRAPKDGSGTPTLVTAATQPQGLVVDATDVFWVSNLPGAGDDNIHVAPKTGGTSTIFKSQLGGEVDDIITDGTFLYVAAQGGNASNPTAYTIPIAADGGAGSSFAFLPAPMFGEKNYLAAHPGEFCVASVATCAVNDCAGIQCNVGMYSTFAPTPDLFVSAMAMSPCALVYGELYAKKQTVVAPLRDVMQNRRAEIQLTTDQAVAIASDGERVYVIESGGSLRSLPIP